MQPDYECYVLTLFNTFRCVLLIPMKIYISFTANNSGYFIVTWCLIQVIQSSLFKNIRIEARDKNLILQYMNEINDLSLFQIVYDVEDDVNFCESFVDCSLSTNQKCRKCGEETYFIINKLNDHCVTLNYSSNVQNALRARIDISDLHLYGGSEHMISEWPVDKIKFVENVFVTKTEYYQAVLEPYWLMSNGFYIYVDNAVPLFISVDSKHSFELIAKNIAPYVKQNLKLGLNFTLCKFKNVRVAHIHAVKNFLGKPSSLPDIRRVRLPIWSTWVKYKENIDEKIVYNYAEEIAQQGYGGQIEIDDNWESCYGSLTPNENKFPDLKKLVNNIKRLNFTVTIWVHPFVNIDCEPTHSIGLKNNYFVQNINGDTATRWWRGKASYIDFTNPKATKWFRKRLDNLRSTYDIDSFKFDGGESSFSSHLGKYHIMSNDNPETIVKEYIKMIAAIGTNVHTRVARGTQQYPIFVTMMDRNSNWDKNLGLPTLITQLLQMNIIGYSFVLPDMIGGNFYGVEANAELFIRWLQANVFMPSLQFSIEPWYYGSEYTELAKKFINLHVKYSEKIIELMRKNVETGTPVNAPLWWIAPEDPVALICDSEFLLGEEILIAPMLVENAVRRDIYLPDGYWEDGNKNGDIIKGPMWLRNYEADLSVLPYFKRISRDNLVILTTNNKNARPVENEMFDLFTIFSLLTSVTLGIYVLFLVSRRYLQWKKFW